MAFVSVHVANVLQMDDAADIQRYPPAIRYNLAYAPRAPYHRHTVA